MSSQAPEQPEEQPPPYLELHRRSYTVLYGAAQRGKVDLLRRLLMDDRFLVLSQPLKAALENEHWECAELVMDAIESAVVRELPSSHVGSLHDAYASAADVYETHAAYEVVKLGQHYPVVENGEEEEECLDATDLGLSTEDGKRLGRLLLRLLRLITAFPDPSWTETVLVEGSTSRFALPTAAAALGDMDLLEHLLHVAPDCVHLSGHDDARPIHYACATGRLDIIRRLHAHDPSCVTQPTSSGMLPVHFAAQELSGAALRLVAELAPQTLGTPVSFGYIDHTALTLAARAGSLAAVQAILELAPAMFQAPIDPEQERPILAALRCQHMGIVELLLQHGTPEQLGPASVGGWTALHHAARWFPDAVGPVLRAAPQYAMVWDTYGALPLHDVMSSSDASLEAVRLLVRAYPAGVFKWCSMSGYPIHHAAKFRNSVDIVELLLEAMGGAPQYAAFVFDSEKKLPFDHALALSEVQRENLEGLEEVVDDRTLILLACQRLPSRTALLHHLGPLQDVESQDLEPMARYVVAAHLPERNGWRWDSLCWDELQPCPGLLPLAGHIWQAASDVALSEHLPRLVKCLVHSERATLHAVLRGLHRCWRRAHSRSRDARVVPALPLDPLFHILALAFPMFDSEAEARRHAPYLA